MKIHVRHALDAVGKEWTFLGPPIWTERTFFSAKKGVIFADCPADHLILFLRNPFGRLAGSAPKEATPFWSFTRKWDRRCNRVYTVEIKEDMWNKFSYQMGIETTEMQLQQRAKGRTKWPTITCFLPPLVILNIRPNWNTKWEAETCECNYLTAWKISRI